MIKLIHRNGARRRVCGEGAEVPLAPVVLVGVVVAVPRAAARAEAQGAVVAVGHSAQGVGLRGQGGHVGSPGGAA